MEPPFSGAANSTPGVSFQPLNEILNTLYNKPTAKPPKMILARRLASSAAAESFSMLSPAAMRDSSVAAALSTSAHAVPSGNLSSLC
ncbi:hypothetical protein D3C72_1966400 [compost metagenome]